MPELRVLALARLLECLSRRGYQFTTPTPATHRIVLARGQREAACLRDIFGWSLPFRPSVLPDELRECLDAAGALVRENDLERSLVRVASRGSDLFLHSDFPPTASSVFFGPDSYRFAHFLERGLTLGAHFGSLVDIGAGSGIGAIVAARCCRIDRIVMSDINPTALSYAQANALHAGLQGVEFVQVSDMDGLDGPFDLIVANPPFMADSDGPAYRNGGDMHGAALSLRWMMAAAARLSPSGQAFVYTASAIVAGDDPLKAALARAFAGGNVDVGYAEIDPDIFGDELALEAYADVERIAAIGVTISRSEKHTARQDAIQGAKRFFEMLLVGGPPPSIADGGQPASAR